MRRRRYIYVLMLCVALFAGCRSDESTLDAALSDMVLSEFAGERGDGGLWSMGDQVGVAMLSDGSLSGVANSCYSASYGGSIADFAALSPLSYPDSGEASFVGYYPYCESAESVESLDIDVTTIDQNWLVAVEQSCRYGEPLSLEFEPLLSKVQFYIYSAAGYDSAMLGDITLTLGGLSTTASYNLVTGEFDFGSVESVGLSDDGDDNIYMVALIPQSGSSASVTMSFASSSATYSYDLGVDEISSGLVYTYSATVSDSGVEFESLSITPWGDGGSQNGVAQATIPEDYIPIYTADDYNKYLYWNYDEESGIFSSEPITGKYILMADIDLGSDWSTVYKVDENFILDGNGFTITTINSQYECRESSYQVMIIASLINYSYGVIQNVTFAGARVLSSITPETHSYSAINVNYGVVRNCESEVEISGYMWYTTAAIVRYNMPGGYIYNCANRGSIKPSALDSEFLISRESQALGGVVGIVNGGVVKNLYNTGVIDVSETSYDLDIVTVGNVIGSVEAEALELDYLFGIDSNSVPIVGSVASESQDLYDQAIEGATIETYSEEDMKNETFVALLNKGATEVVDELEDLSSLAAWIYNDGGYPTLDITEVAVAPDIDIDVDYEPDGSEEHPYLIASAEDLQSLSSEVAAGDTKSGVYYSIIKDITLTTLLESWVPIGTEEYHFCGHVKSLDGETMMIHLAIANGTARVNGIFGYVGAGATISNIEVGGSIVGNYHIGTLAAYNYGAISNCVTSGSISTQGAYSVIGGLVAENCSGGSVTDCSNSGLISEEGSYVTIGAVIGVNRGTYSGLSNSVEPEMTGYKPIYNASDNYIIGAQY